MRERPEFETHVLLRQQEFDELLAVLAERSPALILVSGEAGMGKTTFLRRLAGYAESEGWSVARADDDGELAVTGTTSPAEFDRRVRELLGLRAARRAGTVQPTTIETALMDESAKTTEATSVIGRVVSGGLRLLESSEILRAATLLRDLGKQAPALILIDGYRPEERTAGWFRTSFLPAVQLAPHPIVVVVAERAPRLAELEGLATHVIPFGPLPEGPYIVCSSNLASKLIRPSRTPR